MLTAPRRRTGIQYCRKARRHVVAQSPEYLPARCITLTRNTLTCAPTSVKTFGEIVDRTSFIAAVQAPQIKYESFTATDVKVRLYRDLAVATGTWSMRAVLKGQKVTSQMRVMHVYMYTSGGYHVVSGQTTILPPNLEQPL